MYFCHTKIYLIQLFCDSYIILANFCSGDFASVVRSFRKAVKSFYNVLIEIVVFEQ